MAETKTDQLEALERVPKTETPEKLRAAILPITRADAVLSAILFGMMLIVSPLYGRPAALGVIALWVLLMWSHAYGRSYQIVGQLFQSAWIKWVQRGVILNKAQSPTWIDRVWESKPPVPLGIQGIGDIGVLHNSQAGTDSIIVTGSGSGISSLPMAVQYQVLERLSEGIRKLTSFQKGSVGVSFVFRRRPPDMVRIHSVYDGMLHPALLNGSSGIRNLHLRAIADETVERIGMYAGEVTMAVVLTVPQHELLRKLRNKRKKGKMTTLPPAALRRMGINKLAQLAVEVLKGCNIDDPKVLDIREVHKYLHDAWDADHQTSNDYRQWLSDSTIEEVVESQRHSPGRISVDKDCCLTDGTYHSVIRITGGPARETDDFFSQLHAADVPWLTVSLLGKVTKSNLEYGLLDRLIPMRHAFRQEALGIVHEGPKARKKAEDIARRQETIFERHVSQRYNILLVVSDTDPEELADGVEEVLRTTRSIGLEAEQVLRECRQVPAHWSATTGVDML